MTDVRESPPPRANPRLAGHEAAEDALARAFASGRLPHAWLVCGPRGVGKATLAYRFARHVLAGGGRAAQGDGEGAGDGEGKGALYLDPAHPVFRRVAASGHADLLTVERTADPRRKTGAVRSQIVVDDARRVRNFFALTAAEGGWRVAVIDAADEMNRNAANAVLKIVEEPPPRGLLLLVAHVPGRVPATLRSRCRRIVLAPLPAGRVDALLAAARPDIGAEDRALLAALSDGAPGAALELADHGGLEIYREAVGLIAAAPGIDVAAAHAFADKLARRGAESSFRLAMRLTARWIARLATAGARGRAPETALPGEEAAARRLLEAAPPARWAELWEKVRELALGADLVNLDRKQVVLGALLALDSAARGRASRPEAGR